jgi:hypothetical protein
LLTVLPLAVNEVGSATKVVVVPLGAPAVNVMFAVLLTLPMVAVAVFTSALVDTNVAVKIPELFVEPEAGEMVLELPLLAIETA